jgi:hypothetical protein
MREVRELCVHGGNSPWVSPSRVTFLARDVGSSKRTGLSMSAETPLRFYIRGAREIPPWHLTEGLEMVAGRIQECTRTVFPHEPMVDILVTLLAILVVIETSR